MVRCLWRRSEWTPKTAVIQLRQKRKLPCGSITFCLIHWFCAVLKNNVMKPVTHTHTHTHTHTSIFIKELSTLVAYLWYSDVLVWLLSWEKGSWRLFFEESFLGASQMPRMKISESLVLEGNHSCTAGRGLKRLACKCWRAAYSRAYTLSLHNLPSSSLYVFSCAMQIPTPTER